MQMDDSAAASLLAETGSYATNTLERATLTRPSPHAHRTVSTEKCVSTKAPSYPGESSAFWAIVVVLIVMASGNLLLTFFAMGVLRLGHGMESIELIPGSRITKFFGFADLGNIQKSDGNILGYADVPFQIVGDRGKLSFSVNTVSKPPALDISPLETEVRNIKNFKVVDPVSGMDIFTTSFPDFGLPHGVKNLHVREARTSRITSGSFSDMKIHSDATIRLKGNEGIHQKGNKMTWTADQDIFLKSINGSLSIDAGSGIFVEVNTLPLASTGDFPNDRGQYKLCLCMPSNQLYLVPIPADNNKRNIADQYSCTSFVSPCHERHV